MNCVFAASFKGGPWDGECRPLYSTAEKPYPTACFARELFADYRYVATGLQRTGEFIKTVTYTYVGSTLNRTMRRAPQELPEIVAYLALGCTIQETSLLVGLSASTVGKWRRRVFERLGIRNSCQLLRWALDREVVEPDDELSPSEMAFLELKRGQRNVEADNRHAEPLASPAKPSERTRRTDRQARFAAHQRRSK